MARCQSMVVEEERGSKVLEDAEEWGPSSREEKIVVAIANFLPQAFPEDTPMPPLSFRVGDILHTSFKSDDWYCGQYAENRSVTGIFPRRFVAPLKIAPDRPGSGDEFDPRDDPIVEEMCLVLREWQPLWKQRFVRSHPAFQEIRGMMLEMLKMRREILFSGKVTVERMQELKQRIIHLIDLGNGKLGLDLVVRDEKGNAINSDKISAIELFRLHEKIAVQTKTRKDLRATAHFPNTGIVTNHIRSYKLVVKLNGFSSTNMRYRFQLLIMLYHLNRLNTGPFTEPLVVEWNVRESYLSLDGNDTRNSVMFTDLNGRDLEKEKRPHIVVFLVRIGSMDAVPDPKKRTPTFGNSPDLRRPFAVAVRDISDILVGGGSDSRYNYSIEDFTMQCVLCGEKESLFETLGKSSATKSIINREKIPEIRLSLHLFDKESEDSLALQERNIQKGRKIGFPEVVLPEYYRSDIFVTILTAELAKSKNVELNLSVYDDDGNRIEGVIYLGAGVDPTSEYRSVVYYHEDKPKWYETMRIELMPELFARAHLRFSFKHRSKSESKDKQIDLPFAVSYLRLVDAQSTILLDATYDLAVYRLTSVGEKAWSEKDVSYTDESQGFFSLRENIQEGMKLSGKKFSLSPKEFLRVSTVTCSTELTNDVHLMSLLKWKENLGDVRTVLKDLRSVNPAEIVKFLRDTLDSIFGILMHFADDIKFDEEVFDALIHVISKLNEVQYEHFKGVMNSYIAESFHATLAHRKLLRMLRIVIVDRSELQSVMKALHFLFKFIVKSRQLYIGCPLTEDAKQDEFEETVVQVFKSMADLMKRNEPEAQVSQCFCLKHLPQTTGDLIQVLDVVKLSECWASILSNVKRSQRSTQFLTTMRELVMSELFVDKTSRSVILPVMCKKIQERLAMENERKIKPSGKAKKVLGMEDPKTTVDDGMPEEMEITVKLLGDILDFLWRSNAKEVEPDVQLLVDELLEHMIKLVFHLSGYDRFQLVLEFLVVTLISLMRQMTTSHFERLVGRMDDRKAEGFLVELLSLFVHLITNPVFPEHWGDMVILLDSVILRTVRCIGSAMKERFLQNLCVRLWENYFGCAVRFITDPALQLETFTPTKRKKILARYKDMRKSMADEVRSMWFSLEMQKIRFIPGIVKDFLEMTLVPDPELRRETIPIFFDMMQCEFCSPPVPGEAGVSSTTTKMPIRGHFRGFRDEVIAQLDALVERGRGDDHYRHIFKEILGEMCEKNRDLQTTGACFVKTVSLLMEKLLMFRAAAADESVNNEMSCCEILLEFYGQIQQWRLHLKYLYKLFELHKAHDNHTEAAYTLLIHYKGLPWSSAPLPEVWAPPAQAGLEAESCRTMEQLKFKLAYIAMGLFNKSHMWEPAIELCKDIGRQCDENTYNFMELSTVLDIQSKYVRHIVTKERFDSEYYRVAFYGRGFPAFLQNKEFICRGSVYERLAEFRMRLMNQFPDAELTKTLDEPSQEVMESPVQLIQINQVSPVKDPKLFRGRDDIDSKIVNYYRHNEVDKFMYSRIERNSSGATSKNEFAQLWKENTYLETRHKLPGILLWFPVVKKWREMLKPIQTAEEAMREDNEKLSALIKTFLKHQKAQTDVPPFALNELDLVLGGRLDAAVMGGIKNYEEAFFTPEYLEANPDDAENVEKVKKLIVAKMERLEKLLEIRAVYLKDDLREWYNRMRDCFVKMKAHVVTTYTELVPDASAFLESVSSEGISVAQSTPEHSGNWGTNDASQPQMFARPLNAFDTWTRRKAKKAISRFTSSTFPVETNTQWYTANSAEDRASLGHARRKSSVDTESDFSPLSPSASRFSCYELPPGAAPPLPQKMNRNSSDGGMSSPRTS